MNQRTPMPMHHPPMPMHHPTPMPPSHGGHGNRPPVGHHALTPHGSPHGPLTATNASEIEAQMTLGPQQGCHSQEGRPCRAVGAPSHQGRAAPFQNPNPTAYYAPPITERSEYDMAVQDRWCNESGDRCEAQRYYSPCHECIPHAFSSHEMYTH